MLLHSVIHLIQEGDNQHVQEPQRSQVCAVSCGVTPPLLGRLDVVRVLDELVESEEEKEEPRAKDSSVWASCSAGSTCPCVLNPMQAHLLVPLPVCWRIGDSSTPQGKTLLSKQSSLLTALHTPHGRLLICSFIHKSIDHPLCARHCTRNWDSTVIRNGPCFHQAYVLRGVSRS